MDATGRFWIDRLRLLECWPPFAQQLNQDLGWGRADAELETLILAAAADLERWSARRDSPSDQRQTRLTASAAGIGYIHTSPGHASSRRRNYPRGALMRSLAIQPNEKAPGLLSSTLLEGLNPWLGDRDSNPNYLIQSQAFYR